MHKNWETKDLQKHYVISDTEIKKYYKLRQLTVHYDENSSLDTAKMLNLYYSSLMLLYKLIFIKINYSGYYIDYSETNLPLKMFKREEAPNKQLHDKQEEK